jgi:hypothetical protein
MKSQSIDVVSQGSDPVAELAQPQRILLSIPNGFQVRQFVHSGIVNRLIEHGCEVLVVSPNSRGEGFVSELPANINVFALDLQQGPLQRRYLAARQHLSTNGQSTATLGYKMVALRERLPSAALMARLGGRLLSQSPALRQRILRWERLVLRNKAVERLLSSNRVDCVLLGTPGYTPQDALLLHGAVHYGIPVAAAVMSWDNLSSKGLINPLPDRLLVWSEHMQREAIDLHGIPPECIVQTGSPVHDAFANANRFGSRADNLRRMGLDPRRRLIFYGTNHAGSFPHEFHVVQQVAQWVEQEAFEIPCQLLVRLHPQAVAGPFRVFTEPYRSLKSDRVKVEFPPVYDSSLLWDLPMEDLDHLVGGLRDADVVINTASTISIDAAILDRPVICIAYDPAGELPIPTYYDFTHMANVVQAGAVQLATSVYKLRQTITAYLQDPSLDREGRRRIVKQQFGRVDGLSAKRMVEAVLGTVSETRRRLGR